MGSIEAAISVDTAWLENGIPWTRRTRYWAPEGSRFLPLLADEILELAVSLPKYREGRRVGDFGSAGKTDDYPSQPFFRMLGYQGDAPADSGARLTRSC
jgi:hypothetical protein